MDIFTLFPGDTDLIHVRLEFGGQVAGQPGEERKPSHAVMCTGSAEMQ